jgi:hypothetical protein
VVIVVSGVVVRGGLLGAASAAPLLLSFITSLPNTAKQKNTKKSFIYTETEDV